MWCGIVVLQARIGGIIMNLLMNFLIMKFMLNFFVSFGALTNMLLSGC